MAFWLVRAGNAGQYEQKFLDESRVYLCWLVCLGGFKSSVKREEAQQFFRVRLWNSDDLLDQLFALYNKLDDDLKAEIPLKHMWTIAHPDGD